MRSPRDRSLDHVARLMRGELARHDRRIQEQARRLVLGWLRSYSYREVAQAVGVAVATVQRWEAGHAMPAIERAQVLLDRADQYVEHLKHNREVR